MKINICEVGPRDGLQNQTDALDPVTRAELVNQIAAAGVPRIEAVSFVNDARVPTMADPDEVVAGITPHDGTTYAGLVLNEKGYDRLRETALTQVHYAVGSTDEFNQKNARANTDEGLETGFRVIERAHADDRRVVFALAVAFGCPYTGPVDPTHVLRLAEQAVAAGADEISFADTIGVAVPRQVRALVSQAVGFGVPVGVHLHNTRNTGYANALAAVEAGATVLDSSVGGIGGCPFVPRGTGNICTEDLVYLLHGQGIETGIDIEAMIEVSRWLEGFVDRLEGQLYKAGNYPPRDDGDA